VATNVLFYFIFSFCFFPHPNRTFSLQAVKMKTVVDSPNSSIVGSDFVERAEIKNLQDENSKLKTQMILMRDDFEETLRSKLTQQSEELSRVHRSRQAELEAHFRRAMEEKEAEHEKENDANEISKHGLRSECEKMTLAFLSEKKINEKHSTLNALLATTNESFKKHIEASLAAMVGYESMLSYVANRKALEETFNAEVNLVEKSRRELADEICAAAKINNIESKDVASKMIVEKENVVVESKDVASKMIAENENVVVESKDVASKMIVENENVAVESNGNSQLGCVVVFESENADLEAKTVVENANTDLEVVENENADLEVVENENVDLEVVENENVHLEVVENENVALETNTLVAEENTTFEEMLFVPREEEPSSDNQAPMVPSLKRSEPEADDTNDNDRVHARGKRGRSSVTFNSIIASSRVGRG
jgi:hypothetical protein